MAAAPALLHVPQGPGGSAASCCRIKASSPPVMQQITRDPGTEVPGDCGGPLPLHAPAAAGGGGGCGRTARAMHCCSLPWWGGCRQRGGRALLGRRLQQQRTHSTTGGELHIWAVCAKLAMRPCSHSIQTQHNNTQAVLSTYRPPKLASQTTQVHTHLYTQRRASRT
jgi:hypothetical protein